VDYLSGFAARAGKLPVRQIAFAARDQQERKRGREKPRSQAKPWSHKRSSFPWGAVPTPVQQSALCTRTGGCPRSPFSHIAERVKIGLFVARAASAEYDQFIEFFAQVRAAPEMTKGLLRVHP
jgi:hypothetical protein